MDQKTHVTYSFGPRETRGVVLGLRAGQLVALGARLCEALGVQPIRLQFGGDIRLNPLDPQIAGDVLGPDRLRQEQLAVLVAVVSASLGRRLRSQPAAGAGSLRRRSRLRRQHPGARLAAGTDRAGRAIRPGANRVSRHHAHPGLRADERGGRADRQRRPLPHRLGPRLPGRHAGRQRDRGHGPHDAGLRRRVREQRPGAGGRPLGSLRAPGGGAGRRRRPGGAGDRVGLEGSTGSPRARTCTPRWIGGARR